uniref:RIIa domain-containing protein n=1 Tax=Gadus morhua TaxID=8049 RepID=A0A8C5AN45_GADMO
MLSSFPRGFGSILEGLAREVLRNQPEDIPTYALLYFEEFFCNIRFGGILDNLKGICIQCGK